MFSEQDVDRELKAALSVSPSPDFETRVLQRVQVGRGLPPSLKLRRTSKTPGLLAAAASVVLVAGLFYAMNQPTTVVEEPGTRPVVARIEPRPAPVPATPPTTKRIELPHVARVRPAAAARNTEPEVIVPVNQMEAVRRLADAVNEGRIVLTAPVEGSVEPPVEVVVPPIVVEPLPVPALDPEAGAPSIDIRRLQ
jgi:hypothetical protein